VQDPRSPVRLMIVGIVDHINSVNHA